VNRHSRMKGRVAESAGIRSQRTLSHSRLEISTRGADRVAADEAQMPCPRLERLAPSYSTTPNRRDNNKLLNTQAPVGIRAVTRVPPCVKRLTSAVPPKDSARSRMPNSPIES
jgi:hypothetical protein